MKSPVLEAGVSGCRAWISGIHYTTAGRQQYAKVIATALDAMQ